MIPVVNVNVAPLKSNGCHNNGLSPEMLAAVGARYSRSDLGYDKLIQLVEQDSTSIDRIFKFVDYGHASIADMVPIAIFFDGCSMLMALVAFNLCQQQAGQECSTRYIQLDKTVDDWRCSVSFGAKSAEHYRNAIDAYTALSPEIKKPNAKPSVVQRLQRNWVYDRARVYLPLGATTGFMMIQSAREWVRLVQLFSNAPKSMPEFHEAASHIRRCLTDQSPNMVRMCDMDESHQQATRDWFRAYLGNTRGKNVLDAPSVRAFFYPAELESIASMERNRMRDPLHPDAVTLPVQLISTMRVSEYRDINRHRPGGRSFAWVAGFSQCGQLPWESDMPDPIANDSVDNWYRHHTDTVVKRVGDGDLSALYDLPLGAHVNATISTQLDKAVYLCELRTGPGAHPSYKSICSVWADKLRTLGVPVCARPE